MLLPSYVQSIPKSISSSIGNRIKIPEPAKKVSKLGSGINMALFLGVSFIIIFFVIKNFKRKRTATTRPGETIDYNDIIRKKEKIVRDIEHIERKKEDAVQDITNLQQEIQSHSEEIKARLLDENSSEYRDLIIGTDKLRQLTEYETKIKELFSDLLAVEKQVNSLIRQVNQDSTVLPNRGAISNHLSELNRITQEVFGHLTTNLELNQAELHEEQRLTQALEQLLRRRISAKWQQIVENSQMEELFNQEIEHFRGIKDRIDRETHIIREVISLKQQAEQTNLEDEGREINSRIQSARGAYDEAREILENLNIRQNRILVAQALDNRVLETELEGATITETSREILEEKYGVTMLEQRYGVKGYPISILVPPHNWRAITARNPSFIQSSVLGKCIQTNAHPFNRLGGIRLALNNQEGEVTADHEDLHGIYNLYRGRKRKIKLLNEIFAFQADVDADVNNWDRIARLLNSQYNIDMEAALHASQTMKYLEHQCRFPRSVISQIILNSDSAEEFFHWVRIPRHFVQEWSAKFMPN